MKIINTLPLPKFLFAGLFWGTYFVPMYSFEKTFRLLEVTSNDFWGVYRNGILVFSGLAIVLTLLFLWLSPKFFYQFWYKIVVVVSYFIFYYCACTSIAWDYRSLLGATWLPSEIFSELVKPQWYFYVCGGVGVCFHYYYQRLMSRSVGVDHHA